MEPDHSFDADPIKLASNINNLIKDLRKTLTKTFNVLQSIYYSGSWPFLDEAFENITLAFHELPGLIAMLQEASTNCLNAAFPPPSSAMFAACQAASLLCHVNITIARLGKDLPIRQGEPASERQRLRALLKVPLIAPRCCRLIERLERAVTRLRHIVTDSLTHRLLTEARLTFESISKDHATEISESQHGDLSSVSIDRTLFDIRVIREPAQPGKRSAARGKIDTFADCNIAAFDMLKRLGLEATVQDVTEPVSFGLVGGSVFEPKQKVELSWTTANALKVFVTEFYVSVADEPFDLLFGQPFVDQHGEDISRPRPFLAPILRYESKEKRRLRPENHKVARATALIELTADVERFRGLCGAQGSDKTGAKTTVSPSTAANGPEKDDTQQSTSAKGLEGEVQTTAHLAESENASAGAVDSRVEVSRIEEIEDDEDSSKTANHRSSVLAAETRNVHRVPDVSAEAVSGRDPSTNCVHHQRHPRPVAATQEPSAASPIAATEQDAALWATDSTSTAQSGPGIPVAPSDKGSLRLGMRRLQKALAVHGRV